MKPPPWTGSPQTTHGPDIAPDTPGAEPDDYRQVVLERRLRGCLGPAKSGPARTGAA